MTFKKPIAEYKRYREHAQIVSDLLNNFPELTKIFNHQEIFDAPNEIIQSICNKVPILNPVIDNILNCHSISPLTFYYLTTQYPGLHLPGQIDKLIEHGTDSNADLLLMSPQIQKKHLEKCFERFGGRYEYSVPKMLKHGISETVPGKHSLPSVIAEYMIENFSDDKMERYDFAPFQYINGNKNANINAYLKEKVATSDNCELLTAIANNKTLLPEIRMEALLEGADFSKIVSPTSSMASVIYESCIDVAIPNDAADIKYASAPVSIISNIIPYLPYTKLYDMIQRMPADSANSLISDIARFSDEELILEEMIEYFGDKNKLLCSIIIARAEAYDTAIGPNVCETLAKRTTPAVQANLLMSLAVNEYIIDKDMIADVDFSIKKVASDPTVGKDLLTAIALSSPAMNTECFNKLRKLAEQENCHEAMLVCDLQKAFEYATITECNIFTGALMHKLHKSNSKTVGHDILLQAISRARFYDDGVRQFGNYGYNNLSIAVKTFLQSDVYQKAVYKSPAIEAAIEKVMMELKTQADKNFLFSGGSALNIFQTDYKGNRIKLNPNIIADYSSFDYNFSADLQNVKNAPLASLKEARKLILEELSNIKNPWALASSVYSLSGIYNAITQQIKELDKANFKETFASLGEAITGKPIEVDEFLP